jgi:hypothetical protein
VRFARATASIMPVPSQHPSAAPASAVGRIRGAGIIEWLEWHERRFGKEITEQAVLLAPGSAFKPVDLSKPGFGLDAQAWYPAESFHAILTGLAGLVDAAIIDALVDEAARATMEGLTTRSQSSLYSGVKSVDRYARVANAIWRLIFDTGHVHVAARGLRQHDGTITGWVGHHPLICRFAVMCQMVLYERMGCVNVRIQHLCVSRGASVCGSIVNW